MIFSKIGILYFNFWYLEPTLKVNWEIPLLTTKSLPISLSLFMFMFLKKGCFPTCFCIKSKPWDDGDLACYPGHPK